MKKFLCIFFTVFIMCCCPVLLGAKVYAVPSAQDLYDFYQNNFSTIAGFDTTIEQWNSFVSTNGYSSNEKVYMGIKRFDSTYAQILLFGCSSAQTVTTSASVNGSFMVNTGTMNIYYFQTNSGNFSYSQVAGSTSGGAGGNYLQEVLVLDFSNIIYDPLIPTPDLSVTYIDIPTNASAAFPLVVGLNNASENYYVQFIMENMTPSYIAITPSGDYDVKSYYQFPSRIIANASNLITSDTLNSGLLTGMLSAAWRNDISSYSLTDDNFIAKSSDMSGFANSIQFTAYKTAYLINRDIACFYGNITGLSVRYFVIRDGLVYGGKVKSWTNLYNIGFNESIPDYYIPYEVAQGYENETTKEIVPVETSNPIVNPPANQTGKKTGLSININLGSNVPNYPNYPTIATYNTDNLLVNAIDTAKQLPTFFKNTTGLFSSIFNGLLPEEFWQIVLTGFFFSIVIMIIKVL